MDEGHDVFLEIEVEGAEKLERNFQMRYLFS